MLSLQYIAFHDNIVSVRFYIYTLSKHLLSIVLNDNHPTFTVISIHLPTIFVVASSISGAFREQTHIYLSSFCYMFMHYTMLFCLIFLVTFYANTLSQDKYTHRFYNFVIIEYHMLTEICCDRFNLISFIFVGLRPSCFLLSLTACPEVCPAA